MSRHASMQWNLRQVMADRGIFQTSELVPLLAERGVHISREHVYRLVTKAPQRVNLDILAALCDALLCDPGDLMTPVITDTLAKTGSDDTATTARNVGRSWGRFGRSEPPSDVPPTTDLAAHRCNRRPTGPPRRRHPQPQIELQSQILRRRPQHPPQHPRGSGWPGRSAWTAEART